MTLGTVNSNGTIEGQTGQIVGTDSFYLVTVSTGQDDGLQVRFDTHAEAQAMAKDLGSKTNFFAEGTVVNAKVTGPYPEKSAQT